MKKKTVFDYLPYYVGALLITPMGVRTVSYALISAMQEAKKDPDLKQVLASIGATEDDVDEHLSKGTKLILRRVETMSQSEKEELFADVFGNQINDINKSMIPNVIKDYFERRAVSGQYNIKVIMWATGKGFDIFGLIGEGIAVDFAEVDGKTLSEEEPDLIAIVMMKDGSSDDFFINDAPNRNQNDRA